ncbi:MAG: metal ABC transporter permease [Solobacterium sp.]|nr:metal ABC transporter permease [Solobacterium sp.]
MMELLMNYFSYPFVRYAFIVGVLIALCSSLLGVILVLKRFSYIGDGLSHVAFGAMAVSMVLGIVQQKMFVIMPITVIVAVLLLRHSSDSRLSGDSKIAMISVGSLAIGYLLMNTFNTSANISADVCTTLFGSTSILTLSIEEVWLCIILSLAVIGIFVFLYHQIFAITFDEDFAKATGLKTEFYNFLIAVIMAVIIVMAMNLVGSLLISALLIFPAISAMQVCKSFKMVTIVSALISVICAVAGLLFSILGATPVGSTIVATDIIAFLIMFIYGRMRK